MLLKEYLHSMGIVGFGVRAELPHSLNIIGRFEVTDQHYDVLLISGARVEFPDLYSLLECVRAEFAAAPTYDLELAVMSKTFVITPRNVMGRPWGRNVKKTVGQILMWVTEFNMTGEWSDEVRKLPRLKEERSWYW